MTLQSAKMLFEYADHMVMEVLIPSSGPVAGGMA